MISTRRVGCIVATVAVIAIASSASALTFTCEGVARKGGFDPAGATFTGQFGKSRHGGPVINGAGDVVFFAKPKGGPRRLYRYPAAGGPSIIAEQGGAAPGGGSFTRFERASLNDAGDVAFLGGYTGGQGVFIQPGAGSMLAVARLGDAAPGGGTYAGFDGVSRINAGGDVAFLAAVDGAPSGIFFYDGGTTLLVSVVRVGDATLDMREICDFIAPAVGLGGGALAFQASTKVSCADGSETPLIGIYATSGFGNVRIALTGDPTPIAGTTYATFYGDPDLNDGNQVLFRAKVAGAQQFTGLFLFDGGGPTTTVLAKTGDAAPGGGEFRTITEPNLTDAGRAGFRANVKHGPDHEGVFLADGVDEAVVRGSDPVPSNIFVPGSTYRKIFEEIGVDRGGTHVTYSANVKESFGTKLGLFRCSGA